MAREHLLKIGVSGIRGVVGEFLTPALACQFAQAFGTYVGAGRVVVGRDTRSSGPMLEHAVMCGLLAELRERYPDGRANVADGLRIDWPNRWFHVRVSQTEPVVRVIAEQQGAPPVELMAELLDQVRSFA